MPDFLLTCPAMVKILGSLGLILIFNLFRAPVLLSILLATILLGLWVGHTPLEIGQQAQTTLSSGDNLLFFFVVLQVIWFSAQLAGGGTMQELVRLVPQALSKRWAMATLPALVGFLPMPGGAIFSAPMVQDCDPENHLDGQLKAQVNYWFRHVWEFWWPLYFGVQVAIHFSGLSLWQFMGANILLSLFPIVGGYWFLLRRIPKEPDTGKRPPGLTRQIFALAIPVLVVILVSGLLSLPVPGIEAIRATNSYLPMFGGLLSAAIFLQARRPLPLIAWKKILLSHHTFSLGTLVLIILIYSDLVRAPIGDTTPIRQMAAEVAAWGIPVIGMVMAIPFLCGLVLGVGFGFTGTSFPIIFALLAADAPLSERFFFTTLGYGCGYIGMMLSPVHVCYLVTTRFFKVGFFEGYRRLWGPLCVTLFGALLLSALWRIIL